MNAEGWRCVAANAPLQVLPLTPIRDLVELLSLRGCKWHVKGEESICQPLHTCDGDGWIGKISLS